MKIIISTVICIFSIHIPNLYALDDLLMTVQERTKIDFMRSGQAPIIKNSASSPKAQAVSMELNGFFFNNRDQREKGTLWIDGKQITGDELSTKIKLNRINEQDKTVSVLLENTNSTVPIKAGQKLMLDDGQIQDVYE